MARILGCQAKEPREKALQLTQRDCLNNTLFPNSERNTADICYLLRYFDLRSDTRKALHECGSLLMRLDSAPEEIHKRNQHILNGRIYNPPGVSNIARFP